MLARLVLPVHQWAWIRAEEKDTSGCVDLELGPPGQPARSIVELKALKLEEAEGMVGRLLGRKLLNFTQVEEAVEGMTDDELISSVSSVRAALAAAPPGIVSSDEPRRFVALMVTALRAIVREV